MSQPGYARRMDDDQQRSEPASHLLAELLRDVITRGDLAPGDRLPSERVLASEHRVARNTARAAIRLLADQGLVDVHHGRGVFVRHPRKLLRFGAERYSRALRDETGLSPFRAEVTQQQRTPRVDCTSIQETAAPADVAERLGLHQGDPVTRRENWYYADDEPVQYGVTWIPWSIAEGSPLGSSADLGPGSLYARFEEARHSITTIREEVMARMPSPEESRRLQVPDGVPVLVVTHTGLDQHQHPFEVTVFTMRADLNGLDYTMPVTDPQRLKESRP